MQAHGLGGGPAIAGADSFKNALMRLDGIEQGMASIGRAAPADVDALSQRYSHGLEQKLDRFANGQTADGIALGQFGLARQAGAGRQLREDFIGQIIGDGIGGARMIGPVFSGGNGSNSSKVSDTFELLSTISRPLTTAPP